MAAGVASLIVALAINNGFRQDLQQRLLGSTSHISLLRVQSDGIKDWPALLERLSKQPHVVAAAPVIYEQVLISRGPRARGAVLKGMIPLMSKSERSAQHRKDRICGGAEGKLASPTDANTANSHASLGPKSEQQAPENNRATTPDSLGAVEQRVAAMPPIILGKDMADELGATVGSTVMVTSPRAN